MARICFVLVAGLDKALLAKAAGLPTLGSFKHTASFQPPFPSVTCSVQATLTTGVSPAEHGIICNGLYTHGNATLQTRLDLTSHAESRVNVSFWEQSNTLLNVPRFWQAADAAGSAKKKVAMLFWQNSMNGAADVVLTPKPVHTPDGKTLTACFSDPGDLYPLLTAKLGPFPLHNYWSPMAGLPSSQWIMRAAEHVWTEHQPDLQFVYVPHMDYNLQRVGPNHPAIAKDIADVDALLAPLAAQVRADGGTLIVAGDYGMHEADTPVLANLALRRAGLLATKADGDGKLLVDYAASKAFVMADHQAAFLYCGPDDLPAARATLEALVGVESVTTDLNALNLNTPRAGAAVLVATPNAWFAHDWWEHDGEKPKWQFGVDIHNKPGYDPRELFFDPVRKCIAQDASLVKGSHGRTVDTGKWPVIMADTALPSGQNAELIAPWLAQLLAH